MRFLKFLIVGLVLLLALSTLTACGLFAGSPSQDLSTVKVTAGDLRIKISGSGRVEAETDAKPSFSSGGKIIKLYIKEGDKVTRGMVLAELEKNGLELTLAQSKVGLAQAQVGLTQALSGRTRAESAVIAAQFALDATQPVSDIKDNITKLQQQITAAEVNLAQAQAAGNGSGVSAMAQYIKESQIELSLQQRNLNDLLSREEFTQSQTESGVSLSAYYLSIAGKKYDRLMVQDVKMKALQVQSARQGLDQAGQLVVQAGASIDEAGKAVAVAQKRLDEATVTAGITGTAVEVNVKEGDTVFSSGLSAAVPVYLVDTNSLYVNAQIDETKIRGLQIGQKAAITLDSALGIQYDGLVDSVAMAPAPSLRDSGRVAYDVKIAFSGPPPPEVKLGMNADVIIVTLERTGVLKVPNQTIRLDGLGRPVVQIAEGEKLEERAIQIGITDGVFTEVTGGLVAGEILVIKW